MKLNSHQVRKIKGKNGDFDMKFSVLIPVYNVEKYLSQCLDSVMSQTFRDFEVLIIDDGSTDNSGKICDLYYERFPEKIRVLHRENRGLLMTRREEMRLSKGEYLVFVDSDDWVAPTLLEYVNREIEKYACDLLIYNYSFVYPTGVRTLSGIKLPNDKIFTNENKIELLNYFVSTNKLNMVWCKAVKKNIVDIDVDYSDCKVTIGEDLLQSLPMISRAERIVYTSEDLYSYRKAETSFTGKMRLDYLDSLVTVNKTVAEYMNRWELNSQTIKAVCANELTFYVNSYLRALSYDIDVVQKAIEKIRGFDRFKHLIKGVCLSDFSNKRIGFRVLLISKMIANRNDRSAKAYLILLKMLSGINFYRMNEGGSRSSNCKCE